MAPEGWRFVSLKELLSPESSSISVEPLTGYPLLGVRLYGEGCHVQARKSGGGIRANKLTLLQPGQLVYNKMWASKGAFGIVPDLGTNLYATSEYPAFCVDSDCASTDYLLRVFCSDAFLAEVGSRSRGTTSRARLHPRDFLDQDVLLPPRAEQRRIAEILGSVDEAIQATEAVIEKTERVKEGSLEQLLAAFLSSKERSRRQPDAGSLIPLGETSKVQTGVAKNKAAVEDPIELPYLRVANVQDGYFDLSELKTLTVTRAKKERYLLQRGDVLVTEGGDADKLGRGAVWYAQVDPCLHQNHVFSIRTDRSRLLPEFLALQLSSRRGRKYFLGCAKQTTNLASINSTQLKAFPTLTPSLEDQERCVRAVETFHLAISRGQAQKERLMTVKQGLLQDLLSGRVRVPLPAA